MKTINHVFLMTIGAGFAGRRSGGGRLALILAVVVAASFATRAKAQVKEPAKPAPKAARPAGAPTPPERDRLLNEFHDLDRQAAQHYEQQRPGEAKTALKRALSILERVYPRAQFPDGHPDIARLLGNLGMIEFADGDFAGALSHYRDFLAMTRKVARRGDPEREKALLSLSKRAFDSAELVRENGAPELSEGFNRLAIAAAESADPDFAVPQGDMLLAAAWFGLVGDLRRQDKVAEEEEALRKLIDLLNARGRHFPDQTGEMLIATCFHDLAFALVRRDRDAEAIPLLQRALELWRRLYPEKTHPRGHPEILNTLASLAHQYAAVNQLARAEATFREAVAMSRRLGPLAGEVGAISALPGIEILLRGHGRVLVAAGRPVEAEACLRESLSLARRAHPAAANPRGHDDIASTLMELGRALGGQHKLDEAESVEGEALAMSRRLAPLGDRRTTEILRDLGRILRARGKLVEAAAVLDQAMTMARAQDRSAGLRQLFRPVAPEKSARIAKEGRSLMARVAMEIGRVHADRGDYATAKLWLFDALELAGDARDRAEICDRMAAVLILLGEKSRGQAFVAQAIAIRQELYPKADFPHGHPDLAMSLAREAKTMEIDTTFGYGTDPETGAVGPRTYRDTIADDQAADRYRRALEMFAALRPEKAFPRGSVEYSESLWMAARWHRRHGRLDRAEEYGRRSLRMLEGLFPRDQYPDGHPLLAARLGGLGADLGGLALHRGLKERGEATPAGRKLGEEALEYGRRGLAMCERLFPKDAYPHGHPALAEALYNLGVIYRANMLLAPGHEMAMLESSEDCLRRSVEVSQRVLYRILADCSEAEGLNYQNSQPPALEFLAMGWSPTSAEFLFNAVVERKAAVARVAEQRRRFVATTSDPEVRELGRNLQETREKLARALLAGEGSRQVEYQIIREGGFTDFRRTPEPPLNADTSRLYQLARGKEQLEWHIAQRIPAADRILAPRDWAAELRRALPPGTALVEFLCYNANEISTGERGAAYTALVIRPDVGAERVISDFSPYPYDQFLREWREKLASSPVYQPDDPSASLFRERLWEPIDGLLGPSTRTVYIAPDGELTHLPWAALPGRGTGRILLEDHALAIVPDGRQLLQQLTAAKQAGRGAGRILAVGDIRYGEPKDPGRERALTRPARSGAGGQAGMHWRDLPGTRAELATVAMLARGREVIRLTGEDATPARLTRELTGTRWAHLGTHGFFQDPNALQIARFRELVMRERGYKPPVVIQDMRRERISPVDRNPRSLAGLVLAGANQAVAKGRDGDPAGDGGILTAEAIANLPLQDLEVVVLSACETGLGEIGFGEGAFSLERAFHSAGAGKVVATLWSVNDQATAALMRVFYHELWTGKRPVIEALREAQLAIYYHPERIKALAESRGPDFAREVTLATTPATGGVGSANRAPAKFWAGFVLSGGDVPSGRVDRYNVREVRLAGPLPDSIPELREVLRLKPDHAEAHARLGDALRLQARYFDAARELRTALRLRPDDFEAHYHLALALHRRTRHDDRPPDGPVIVDYHNHRTDWDLDEAIGEYRAAIRLRPGSADVHHDLGHALEDRGKTAEAAARYQEAIRLRPGFAEVYLDLGRNLARQGRREEAIDQYRAAIRVRPGFAGAHHELGLALREQHRDDEAVAEYRKAIELDPHFSDPHIGLGVVYHARGKLDEAAAEYREAIRLEPDSVVAHEDLGLVLRARGKLDEAVGEFQAALRSDPGRVQAHYQLAWTLVEQASRARVEGGPGIGREDRSRKEKEALLGAIAEFRSTIELNPRAAEAHHGLGRALASLGRIDEALVAFREAVRIKPDLGSAYLELGYALIQKSQAVEAAAAFRKAVQLDPRSADAHRVLGEALQLSGKFDEAIAAFREALRVEPRNPMARYDLGTSLLATNRVDEAITEFREATRLMPEDLRAHLALGMALLRQGKVDEAVNELGTAVRLGPEDEVARLQFGISLFAKSRVDEAIREFREAARIRPDSHEAYLWLGRCLSMRNLDEAVAAYRTAIRTEPREEGAVQFELGLILSNHDRHDEAIAALRRAVRLRPDHVDGHQVLGNLLAVRRLYDEAVAEHRKVTQLEPGSLDAHLSLGYVLLNAGDWSGALAALRKARSLAVSDPQAAAEVDEVIRKAERLAGLDRRWSRLLEGADRPADAAEAADFGEIAQAKAHYAVSARLFADAFAGRPKLAEDVDADRRYHAARSASLAACGEGKPAAALDEASRARLRRQALDWLGSARSWWQGRLESGKPDARAEVSRHLAAWKANPDLAGVRDPKAIAKLPDGERKAWRDFWAEVDALEAKARVARPGP